MDYNLNSEVIKEIIENLPNGKSIGIGGVSYEMLKYSSNELVSKYLKIFFEKLINYQQMAYLFNVSIIKPLIKDTNKSKRELNNLRPVAVSDAFANIFEAVILKEIEKGFMDSGKQFGFKKKSSCGHSIFDLKQAIRLSNLLKKRLYVCAIDKSNQSLVKNDIKKD
ncbi:unnamed protein product [Brachionus calyciflorus]|uniref:Reverse transcriptase domain-containing protein n=1 Tax=Brachionus calyciflorus TaxID=104777 RepID=A0A813VUW2_9BILA|nr:unnamed protein product [Brachionus calyciflorus]